MMCASSKRPRRCRAPGDCRRRLRRQIVLRPNLHSRWPALLAIMPAGYDSRPAYSNHGEQVKPPNYTFALDRLGALAQFDILDTPPEQGFDDVVELASYVCQTPVAFVSLVAEDRQWFKARIGFDGCQTDLNSSICAHALVEPDL